MAYLALLLLIMIIIFNLWRECIPFVVKKISQRLTNHIGADVGGSRELNKEMALLQKQLCELDMIDEFAKYAKTERKIQKLQKHIDGINKKKKSKYILVKIAVHSASVLLQVVIGVSFIWSYRYTPLLHIPDEWLYPLTSVIAFPSGVPGAVGITAWLLMCRHFVSKTFTPTFDYISSILGSSNIDMSEYDGNIPLD